MPAPPFQRVDHLVVAVRDLDGAAAAYAVMLGRAPSWRGRHPAYGTANALFGLGNCYLELLALDDGPGGHPIATALRAYLERRDEGLFAIALGCDEIEASAARLAAAGIVPGPIADGEARATDGAVRRWRSFMLDRADTRGIMLFAIAHDDPTAVGRSAAIGAADAAVSDVDHVVLFSDDLAAALALWHDRLGVPERWRREFPERGTVNVGLRLGGVTLELVAPLAAGAAGERGERAWGLAFRVPDVDAAVARLRATDLPVGDARPGLAPGTRVATVKWADRLPTLLIQS